MATPKTAKTSTTKTKQTTKKNVEAVGLFEGLPTKEGGGQWRAPEVLAAQWRAEGLTWALVKERLELEGYVYTQGTLENYPRRDWWPALFAHMDAKHKREVEDGTLKDAMRARREWAEQDAKLKRLGVQLAMTSLIEVMQGKRTRDEMLFRKLRRGDPQAGIKPLGEEAADEAARKEGDLPNPAQRVYAAQVFLTASGYKKQNEQLAKLAADAERQARDLNAPPDPSASADTGARVVRVSVEMAGVELGPPAADGGEDGA